MTRANAENFHAVLTALAEVTADPARLGALLAAAEDDDAAVASLRETYDLTAAQAQAVLDGRFRALTRARRNALDTQLHEFRDALSAPWDPPLEARATLHADGSADVVLAGATHRVQAADREACLTQVASLVREQLARPERRVVAVRTGATDGPTTLLVDPLGAVEYVYGGER